jgi:hypothetical protein
MDLEGGAIPLEFRGIHAHPPAGGEQGGGFLNLSFRNPERLIIFI